MRIFGDSVFSAEGEGWRRHRRIVGPAFGSALYRLVWEQSLKTYREMISEEGWTDKKSVDIPVLQAATFKVNITQLSALGKITYTQAGILSSPWSSSGYAPSVLTSIATAQGEMTVQQVMRIVLDNHVFLVFAPEWLKRLPFPSIRHTVGAYTKLEQFMKDQVQIRREEIRGHTTGEYTRRDAFSMLVQANESEGEKHKLDDMELIGNIYVMLVAGHETTAHTLAATLGFLAIHQDAQDEVVQQIVDVVGYERDPAFEDYHSLNKVLAAFYEALRFFRESALLCLSNTRPIERRSLKAAGHIVLRVLSDDTIIQIPNPRGEEGTQPLPVPKETWFIADMIGIHRNPRHFEEPDKYKPSRWHDMNNDSEQFTAFSFGPRACIGRKFATTEALCFLTMFLRDWEVQPILRPGESTEQWQSRVLDGKISFTLGAKDVPIRLTRRERK
ncbi:hypothetical protein V5O48_008231 [Marasmius crinis-equi]|uniref:Cytochrome P450 n=1 Tax=Marasmius crinis-equi TaxID=585013 RepID=A0ABR3FEH0_9AGAR